MSLLSPAAGVTHGGFKGDLLPWLWGVRQRFNFADDNEWLFRQFFRQRRLGVRCSRISKKPVKQKRY
jgi:hypothetical protein